MTKRIRIGLVAAIAAALMLNGVATLYVAATAPTIRACVKSSGAQKGLMRQGLGALMPKGMNPGMFPGRR